MGEKFTFNKDTVEKVKARRKKFTFNEDTVKNVEIRRARKENAANQPSLSDFFFSQPGNKIPTETETKLRDEAIAKANAPLKNVSAKEFFSSQANTQLPSNIEDVLREEALKKVAEQLDNANEQHRETIPDVAPSLPSLSLPKNTLEDVTGALLSKKNNEIKVTTQAPTQFDTDFVLEADKLRAEYENSKNNPNAAAQFAKDINLLIQKERDKVSPYGSETSPSRLSQAGYELADTLNRYALSEKYNLTPNIDSVRYDQYRKNGEYLASKAQNAADFETRNVYGKKQSQGIDAVKAYLLRNFPDLNMRNFITDPEHEWIGGQEGESVFDRGHDFFDAMTEEQKKILGYYIATDEEKAERYVEAITLDVGSIMAEKYAASADDWYDKLLYNIFSVGTENFATGMQGAYRQLLGETGYQPPTPIQQGGTEIRDRMEENGEDALLWISDIGANIVQMVPSLAVGAFSKTAGATLMGVSASGNAYNEAINKGLSRSQASTYATLVGASETLLEKALGVVGNLGGKSGAITSKILANIDGALTKAALSIPSNMASEFVEESLQTLLEPWFMSVITNEEYAAPGMDEVLYNGMIGALAGGLITIGGHTSSLALRGINKASQSIEEAKAQKQTHTDVGEKLLKTENANQDIKKLIDNAQQSGDKKLQKAANKVAKTEKDGAYDVSARKVGRLAQMSKEQLAQSLMDTATGNDLKSQTIEKLTKSGMNQKGAERAFDLIARDASRGSESKELQSLINKNPDIRTMYDNMVEYLSEEAVTKRVEDVAKASPVPEITNRITEQRLKDAGIEVVDESGDIDNIDSVVNVDEYGNFVLKRESGETVTYDPSSDNLPNADAKNIDKVSFAVGYGLNGAQTYVKLAPDNASVEYKSAFNDLYNQGNTNKAFAQIDADISLEAQKAIYEAGKADFEAAKQRRIDAETEAKEKEASFVKKEMGFKSDRVTLSEEAAAKIKSVSDKGISDQYKAAVKVIDGLAKMLQVNINIVASETDASGNYIGARGMYNRATNTFTFDIMSGMDNVADISYSAMIKTAGHELTHFIQNWSPSKYLTLKNTTLNFLTEEHSEQWINKQLEVIQKDNKAMGKDLTLEQAKDELVADAFEDVLTNIDFAETILRTDKTLFDKIHSWVKKNVNDFKKNLGIALKDVEANSEAATTMRKAGERAQALYNQWADAFSTALENSTSGQTDVLETVDIDAATESVSPQFSLRSWLKSEYVQKRNETAKEIAEALGVSIVKAKRYIDDINSIAKIIADAQTRLDYEASTFGSAFVSNVEYGGSFDFTTLCKKRRIYTGTFTEIQKRLRNTALSPDDILKIRNMMIEKGIEATCGLCYVEGSRANMGKFSKEFIRLYKRDNPDAWIPDMADVNTPDGVESMRINHPEAYEQYEYFWNHYGKLQESDPALFASQQKPKLYEARKEYKGEILERFEKDDKTVEKKNRNGGIRMQSFSDFEIVHLIDTMQIIMDMSRVGLAGQAYTKVPEFAKAFGNTGLKINLSLISKGVDADGKLIFDDREGMPHETAFDLRNKYSANVGTIIVTFTDEQLMAAMADDRIDFIIPFHRSQWKKGQYGAMGLPKGTKDYTFMQNEKLIKPTYHEYRGRMVKDKATNYMPNEYWDFSKSGKENAEAYLKMCAENNKRPKFYKLLDYDGKGTYSLKKDGSTDGYWKLLIDFKMYDNNGVGSPQKAVAPNFNMEESVKMLDEYKGGHQSYPVAYDVVDAFVEEYSQGKDATQLSARRRNKNYLDVESRFGVAESVSKYAETVSDPALKAKLKANATTYAKKLDEYETESIRYDNATANGWDEMAATAYYAMTMAKTVINQIETDADFALSLETAVGAFESYSEETRKQYQEKYKKAIAESKDKVAYIRNEMRAMQRDISDSERKAKEFAQREKKANYRAKQIELRNQRDRYMSFLTKEKTRIKTALEKPSETASVPKDTQELAKKLIGVIDSFNKFNNSSALTKSSAELIEKIVSISNAEMEAGRSKSLVQKTNATDKVLLGLKLSFDQVRSSLDALVAEYEKLSPEYKRKDGEKAPSAAAAIVYDEQLHNALKELSKDFSAPELVFEHGLSYVYEGIKIIRAMNHQLLKANQMYVKGKSVEVLKLRNMLLQDVKTASPFLNKFLGNALVSNVLMPKTMLHIVFGATENADIFYDMIDDGQMRYIRFMNGAREIFAPVANEIENEKFKSDKPTLKTGLKYMDGTDVLLNYEFALSFIKIVENEDSLRHAVWGGLQIPDLIPYNKGDKSAYNNKRLVEHAQPEYAPDAMTDEQIAKTLEKASEEGRTITDQEYLDMYAQQIVWNNRQNLAKEIEAKYKAAALMLKEQMSKTETGKKALTMLSLMTRYYDQYARKYLNEATMELYGFEKTLQEGKTYYPIRVRKDEKASDDNVDIIRDFSLENWGSMKHRVDSKKGIELYGALTELESYMENTAKFYAWTTVTKNMKKILNTQIIDDNGTVTTLVGKVNQLYGSYDPNVKGVKNIKNKFMSGFEQYMKDLQTEIIGANKGGEKWAKLQGAFVTNALLLNISTPLVQYSATPLVAVDSGYLSFIKTVAKGGKIPALLSEAQKKYVAKYSEVYKYRSSGLINVDLAAAKQNKGVVSKALSSKALAWTESADAQVLGKQFYALLDHVKRTHKGISAEEAARIAGKQLDQTIYEFQANYTVLQRAPVLRGSGIKKLLFGTFRTQQITLLNAMIDSSVKSHTLSEQMKQVKKDSPEYKALKRKRSDSMKRTAKIHLAIALSNALNAFIRMGVGVIRRKDDDEKGETAFIDFLDSYLSMIPLFGDIASAIVSIASGRMFYGEKVFSLGMLDTLSDSVTSAAEIAGMLFDGEDQELSKYIKELTDALAVAGVPARNIYNIIKMIMGWAEDAADAAGWDWDLDVDEW